MIVGIRPSDLEDADVWGMSGSPTLDVQVDITEELGSEVNVLFTIDAPPVTTEEALAAASDEGADDILPLITEQAQFCARVDPRTQRHAGGADHASRSIPAASTSSSRSRGWPSRATAQCRQAPDTKPPGHDGHVTEAARDGCFDPRRIRYEPCSLVVPTRR